MKKLLIVTIFVVTGLLNNNLKALNFEIDILNDNYQPYNVLISDFYVTPDTVNYYEDIKEIIIADLEDSGMFIVRSTKEKVVSGDLSLRITNFDLSKYMYYDATLLGKFIYNSKKQEYKLEYVVIDNETLNIRHSGGYRILKKDLKKDLKLIAHEIADGFYKGVTGQNSYFNSYLVHAEGSKLWASDYKGNDKKLLVQNKGKIYGPVISPKGNLVAYVSFEKGLSSIYIYDLVFDKAIKLASLEGLSLTPRFSKDGKELLFSVAKDGSANIFLINIAAKSIKKLTNSYSINLAGGYSYDDKLIVFNSDRVGSPHIYVMNKDGSNVRKVSQGSGGYYNPSFSNESNIILFTKIYKDVFSIGLLNLSGSEKIVARDSLVESPSWLSNGRHIIYQYKYNKDNYAFYIMDLISGYKISLMPSKNSTDPYLSQNIAINKKNSVEYSVE